MLLADRAAQAVLAACHGGDVEHRAPEPVSATRDNDSRGIAITFAPVTSRMDTISPTANPFMVEDDEGSVPVREVQYTGTGHYNVVFLPRPRGSVVLLEGRVSRVRTDVLPY